MLNGTYCFLWYIQNDSIFFQCSSGNQPIIYIKMLLFCLQINCELRKRHSNYKMNKISPQFASSCPEIQSDTPLQTEEVSKHLKWKKFQIVNWQWCADFQNQNMTNSVFHALFWSVPRLRSINTTLKHDVNTKKNTKKHKKKQKKWKKIGGYRIFPSLQTSERNAHGELLVLFTIGPAFTPDFNSISMRIEWNINLRNN